MGIIDNSVILKYIYDYLLNINKSLESFIIFLLIILVEKSCRHQEFRPELIFFCKLNKGDTKNKTFKK